MSESTNAPSPSVHAYVDTGTNPERCTLSFAHAESMMPFVTLLGLFKDPKGLYANATLDEMKARSFRASFISPFAANAYFVLYKCTSGMFFMNPF